MAIKKTTEVLEIRPIEIQKVNIRIVGDTPLIMHAWSEKAKRMMLDAQMGLAKGKKEEPKNPVEDFIRSTYSLTDMPEEMTEEAFSEAISNGARFGFPVTAFKQAAISAAYRMGWAKDKVSLRGAFFIDSDENGLIEIHSDEPKMREDMVKVGMGTADIRYRGEFANWYADMTISYNMNGNYSLENIMNIINAGGYICGVGEWRPEKDGQYGQFHVANG
jgi:hypothetical protein